MAGVEKIKFNPFIKGNFDYIKDYDGELESLQNSVNQGQTTINSQTIERIDSIESILAMLQSGQIIPAERQGTIENGNIIYNITYENYVTLKGAQKFFVILDNPLQTGSTSAEELVKLKIQTDKLRHTTIAPPTVSDTPSQADLYAGMVGYNAEKNLGLLVSGGYVYFKQGGYAKTDVFDIKCTYTINESGKMLLAKYVEPEPEENEEQETETTEVTEPVPPAPQPVIIVISGRNENKITFETTGGYFQLTNGETVDFTDPLTITEGEDKWSVLRVMHKDNTDAKLKDILERRVLMRAIIDEKNSKQDSAYIIGGAGMESTAPASFIKANAYVVESLEEDLILNNENFPSESIIYIVKAKNDFSVSKLASIIFNNHDTGFTTDRSFEIWLEKDTGQNDMLLLKNGTVETNALNRGECVRLFFDYETSNWSTVYIAADNVNQTHVTSNDGSIKVTQTGQTFDLSKKMQDTHSYHLYSSDNSIIVHKTNTNTNTNNDGSKNIEEIFDIRTQKPVDKDNDVSVTSNDGSIKVTKEGQIFDLSKKLPDSYSYHLYSSDNSITVNKTNTNTNTNSDGSKNIQEIFDIRTKTVGSDNNADVSITSNDGSIKVTKTGQTFDLSNELSKKTQDTRSYHLYSSDNSIIVHKTNTNTNTNSDGSKNIEDIFNIRTQKTDVFNTVGGYVEGTGNQTPSTTPSYTEQAIIRKAVYKLGKWNLPSGNRDYVLLHGLQNVGTTIKIIDVQMTLTDNNGKEICIGSLFNNPLFTIYPNSDVYERSDRITIRCNGSSLTNESRFSATASSGAASRGEIIIEYRELKPLYG